MKKILTLFICFLWIFQVKGAEYFTYVPEHYRQAELVYLSLVIIDWTQTKKFRSEGISERNPILGKYPSQSKVDQFVMTGIVLHLFGLWAMPNKYRDKYLGISIILEAKAVGHNYMNGVRIHTTF